MSISPSTHSFESVSELDCALGSFGGFEDLSIPPFGNSFTKPIFRHRFAFCHLGMSSPAGSVRHRNPAGVPKKAKDTTPAGVPAPRDAELDALVKANLNGKVTRSEWDYKLALGIITVLAFLTRFWGISHPNEVVFDEVHFGKVGSLFAKGQNVSRKHNS